MPQAIIFCFAFYFCSHRFWIHKHISLEPANPFPRVLSLSLSYSDSTDFDKLWPKKRWNEQIVRSVCSLMTIGNRLQIIFHVWFSASRIVYTSNLSCLRFCLNVKTFQIHVKSFFFVRSSFLSLYVTLEHNGNSLRFESMWKSKGSERENRLKSEVVGLQKKVLICDIRFLHS